jgi:hypothetical protein
MTKKHKTLLAQKNTKTSFVIEKTQKHFLHRKKTETQKHYLLNGKIHKQVLL